MTNNSSGICRKMQFLLAVFKSGRTRQCCATFCANLIVIAYGISIGWPSPSIPLLESENSPLESGPLTREESSWITSMLNIGGVVVTIIYAYTTEKFGRKLSLLFLSVPCIASWLLIAFGTNPTYLIMARFLSGITGGFFHTLPIFVSEISETRIRGALGSILIFSYNIGTLLGYSLGAFVDYRIFPLVVLPLPIIFLVSVSFFPDTPFYYMKNNKPMKAKKALKFYRKSPNDRDEKEKLENEFESIKNTTNKMQELSSSISWKDFKTKSVKKAFGIAFFLMILRNFCGPFAMLNYTAIIFAESGSSLSPNVSSIIVAAVQILGSFCSIIFIEKLGRKPLFIISLFGCAFGLLVLGTYTYVNENFIVIMDSFKWIPLTSFSFLIFISNCGYQAISHMYIAEVSPQKLKHLVMSISFTFSWALAFFVVKYLTALMATIQLHGTVFIFATVSVIGGIIIALFFPETKGKSFDEITQILEK